ncbi:alkaline phosphatase D family protein [Paractinoplanes brasiliensis]|uniref:PhoD-like phosphatase n=1 Tax=Paractinoplanes brasiliensis TaxID=52695 RepID=A0A4R6K0K8_9ACTN|nr:alkaline phosphatase D family protein [Actinoplanes brasiliensis]TDO40665.1 PhoD-like phosphatase [Actinoplanes brasiliensis]GID25736.1 alkaline phosphatase [Actinoplanes brasiliensis]
MTAHLLIGPLLRRVAGTRATIWVETTEAAFVRVEAEGGGSGSAPTFTAYGHHYAIVVVEGLRPDAASAYQVFLDDLQVWPSQESTYPPSVIRTRPADDAEAPVRLIFGSCREATPNSSARRLPPDALDAYSRRLMTDPQNPELRPDLIVLLGDQVYADETSTKVKRFLKRRRPAHHDGPSDQVITFDEYTKLYLESWRDPEVRWLFATVPSVMIFDDHELIDDWNTSESWHREMLEKPWWLERITSGLASYWVYQHLGNMSPDELAADPLLAKVTTVDDATDLLHEFGRTVDSGEQPYQWSYALDVGRTRVVMLDNRCSRVLTPDRREMLPAAEWNWFVDQAHGEYDHLVVGSSLPWLMPPAIHYLESWNESIAASRRPWVAAYGEKLRRAFDLEHWAAFGRSFNALGELFRRLGEGGTGAPGHRVGAGGAYAAPASISVLSGDVHHSYVAEADFGTLMATPVMQLTCSPVHNQVPALMRPLMRFSWSRAAAQAVRGIARSAGVRRPAWRWKRLAGPYFGNAISTLRLTGRKATVRVEGTDKDGNLFGVAEVTYPR